MPRLPARRPSLCLFCAFAASSPARWQRLLPRVQAAHRSNSASSTPPPRRGRNQYNPLRSSNPNQPRDSPKIPAPLVLRGRLQDLKDDLSRRESLASLQLSQQDFDREWLLFHKSITAWGKGPSPELTALAETQGRGIDHLETRLRYLFYAHVFSSRFTEAELDHQKDVANLRYPSEWYPVTRQVQRTVHVHVGPTNSGKTYHALKRLEQADTGIYLGPLRLLAHEVYTRLNAKGRSCALVTGEEHRLPSDKPADMFSCTVEMAPLNTNKFEVAVIDEIQMINHPQRGWAWTQAFLGLRAAEIHVCGEARSVPLLRELCALVGDKVHVHEYERLTPLRVQPRSIGGDLRRLEKGDCVVAFTVLGIHALRKEIEQRTGKHCAIVYGGLPPETRAQQARLFNDPDNDYDFLVASDAIGMGLNLAIKRVIFESVVKYNGTTWLPLPTSEVKQIAGRAGRYRTAHQAVTANSTPKSSEIDGGTAIGLDDKTQTTGAGQEVVGWVTTLDHIDHNFLSKKMGLEPEPITTAGLFPPSIVVERFASYFPPRTPFSYILLRLHEIAEIHPRFHLCALKDQLRIADVIHPIENLSTQDRLNICAAPLSPKEDIDRKFIRTLSECIADDSKSGSLLDIEGIPLHFMDEASSDSRKYLRKLEQLHKMLVCYLWLSFRFPNVFTTRALAEYTKKLVEDQIEKTLKDGSFTEQYRESVKKRRKRAYSQMETDKAQEAQTKTHPIPAPPGMPKEEAEGIVNDTRSFVETASIRDDANEYPEEPLVDEPEKVVDQPRQNNADKLLENRG